VASFYSARDFLQRDAVKKFFRVAKFCLREYIIVCFEKDTILLESAGLNDGLMPFYKISITTQLDHLFYL